MYYLFLKKHGETDKSILSNALIIFCSIFIGSAIFLFVPTYSFVLEEFFDGKSVFPFEITWLTIIVFSILISLAIACFVDARRIKFWKIDNL